MTTQRIVFHVGSMSIHADVSPDAVARIVETIMAEIAQAVRDGQAEDDQPKEANP